MEKFLGSSSDPAQETELQVKFIEEFVRSILLSEIRMQQLAFDKKKLSIQDGQMLRDQLDGLIGILFLQRYTTLQQLVKEIKRKNPSSLENIFEENTFKADIEKREYQERLAAAIVQFIFSGASPKENLDIGLKKIQLIKVFLIKYKGVKPTEIDENLAYLTDVSKMRKSIQNLISKFEDPKMGAQLFKLALLSQTQQTDSKGIILSFNLTNSLIFSFQNQIFYRSCQRTPR